LQTGYITEHGISIPKGQLVETVVEWKSDRFIVVKIPGKNREERRNLVIKCIKLATTCKARMIMMDIHAKKTVPIEFKQVVDAYAKVRQGGKASGIDNESWSDFGKKAEKNLYVVWNRMASGSYFPQAVREKEIPKKDGKMRKLGIPAIRDRIAQEVVRKFMEVRIDKLFHENSYAYRPLKSAHQAIDQVRENCYRYDWVIDLDISKFFDEIDHELMMKAVKHVIKEKWVWIYVERWLKAPIMKEDGTIEQKEGKGTPQGGVISPFLANLYLHFTFDQWLTKTQPSVSFVRYADDIVVHCKSKKQAEYILGTIKRRLKETKLEVKEEKTRIAYCKDYRRTEKHEVVKFEFLGFSFQPRSIKSKIDGRLITGFAGEINQSNQKKIRQEIREWKQWNNPRMELTDIANHFNSKLRGWIGYYGIYGKRSLRRVLWSLERRILKWLQDKYKKGYRKACNKLEQEKEQNPKLFYHWETGYW
jgi:RNA-directed DNA polymerase